MFWLMPGDLKEANRWKVCKEILEKKFQNGEHIIFINPSWTDPDDVFSDLDYNKPLWLAEVEIISDPEKSSLDYGPAVLVKILNIKWNLAVWGLGDVTIWSEISRNLQTIFRLTNDFSHTIDDFQRFETQSVVEVNKKAVSDLLWK